MNTFRGKWLLFGGVTILAAVAAGSIAVWRQHRAPVPVKMAVPVKAAVPEVFNGNEVSVTGRIQAQKVVNIAAPVDGTVESFALEVGQDVFEGQLMARIRNLRLASALEAATEEFDRAQSRVQAAEAAIVAARLEASRARADASRTKGDFDRAEKAFQRQKMLFAEGATPRLIYEKAERDYTQLKDDSETKDALARQMEERVTALNRDLDVYRKFQADRAESLENAKTEVASADLHSPVDGIVVGRRGQPGDEVSRQTEDLFQVATALSAMEVLLTPPAVQLQRIKPGQAASIVVAEMPNDVIRGTVREVSGTVVVVDFTSPTPLIRPGLSAQVTIKLT